MLPYRSSPGVFCSLTLAVPKSWTAIITLGHERIYASLNISYQAPHHWDALGALEFSGLFSSIKPAGLGRNQDLSLYHPVLCLDPKTAIACSLRICISLALIPSWNIFCGINQHFMHFSITVSFGRIRMWVFHTWCRKVSAWSFQPGMICQWIEISSLKPWGLGLSKVM